MGKGGSPTLSRCSSWTAARYLTIHLNYDTIYGFPDSSVGKESACNVGDLGLIPGMGRSPGEGKGCPLQHASLENSRLYSPWGRKELDMTE